MTAAIEACAAHGISRVTNTVFFAPSGKYATILVCWECARTIDNMRSWLWEHVLRELLKGDYEH